MTPGWAVLLVFGTLIFLVAGGFLWIAYTDKRDYPEGVVILGAFTSPLAGVLLLLFFLCRGLRKTLFWWVEALAIKLERRR